jgi:hypothetical protein
LPYCLLVDARFLIKRLVKNRLLQDVFCLAEELDLRFRQLDDYTKLMAKAKAVSPIREIAPSSRDVFLRSVRLPFGKPPRKNAVISV